MRADQTGIFYLNQQQDAAAVKEFPRELHRNLAEALDPRFLLLVGICALVFAVPIWFLSHRPVPQELSDKEILKIQERYAQLVLNQPKPKAEEKSKAEETKANKAAAEEKVEVKEEVKVEDKTKESLEERVQRKEVTKEQRQQKREEISKQLRSSGIFAAITATSGGSGSGGSVTDLLGSADGIGDIGAVSISKGTFATKNTSSEELQKRRGERTSGVGIQREEVGSASGGEIASSANVNITSKPAEISGDAAGQPDRSQSSIAAVINREKSRLVRVYETWLKRDPALGGQLKIKFTILPSGEVSDVSVVKSTTNNSGFDETIVRYVKRWIFPAISSGGSLEVVYPFVFEGSASGGTGG
jgi:TonB family protein